MTEVNREPISNLETPVEEVKVPIVTETEPIKPENEPPKKPEPELVPKQTLDAYKNDMFKYKAEKKALEQKLNDIEAGRAKEEEERLKKNQEWQTLFEAEQAKREELEGTLTNQTKKFADAAKVNAVVEVLGGFLKPEYNRFIDVNAVEISEDGIIIQESVDKEVARIKQNFSERLRSKKPAPLPNEAPQVHQPKPTKRVSITDSQADLRRAFSKVKDN